ncbi:unnamed protein product [Phytomonas sp. EM1]|nr:unnamed protein product [Phytomonas sp. EM1]|eukprot:CCW61482.1 unnamed protein product [Phytomonas sp. isolate EM1]
MKYLAAYALVSLSGKTPSQSDVEAVLKAAGVAVDSSRIRSLFKELGGKSFDELCMEGKSKLGAGGAAAPVSGGAAAAASGAAPAAAVPEADNNKAQPVDDDEDDMDFGLFD